MCGIVIFITSYAYGKNNFFLLLNDDLGIVADNIFQIFTFLGDGLLWIPLLLFFIFSSRKNLLPFLASCFLLTTFFTQICKYIIVPDELRPIAAITGAFVHTVQGVTVWKTASFPSGHSATAFAFYLIFCLIAKNNWWVIIGLLYALLVGYSRVYLAEHFPFDVAGGIMVAIVSVILSVFVQKLFEKRNTKVQQLL